MQNEKNYLNAASFVIFTLSFIVFYYMSPPIFHYPDVSWHILSGEYIIENKEIPEFNIWSSEENPDRWYNLSWLFDVFISLIVSFMGIESLLLFKSAFIAIIVTLLFGNCYRRNVDLESALIATLIASLIISLSSPARPQLITFLMIILFHRILHKDQSLDIQPSVIFSLPILTIIWANCHGGFLVGFLMIGIYGIDAIKNKDRKRFFTLLFTGILCIIAIFINPMGFGIIEGSLRTIMSDTKQVIAEWQPIYLFDSVRKLVFVIVFLLVSNFQIKSATLADKILVVFWFFMGMSAIRHFTIFVIISAPYIAICLNDFNREKNEKLAQAISKSKNIKLSLLGSIIVIIIFISLSFSILNKKTVMDINPIFVDNGLKEASEFILNNYPNRKIYNAYTIGGEILYHSKGKLKVFVDGRAGTAYNDDVLKAFMILNQGLPSWEDKISKYKFDLIVANNDERIFQLIKLKGGWKEVYNEKNITVMIKE